VPLMPDFCDFAIFIPIFQIQILYFSQCIIHDTNIKYINNEHFVKTAVRIHSKSFTENNID
jgi:hypothetical protein